MPVRVQQTSVAAVSATIATSRGAGSAAGLITQNVDVAFYGDSVPRRRVAQARELIESADAVLIVGSSLMVSSSFRFCRLAHEPGIPLLAVNRGLTRADPWLALNVERDCAEVLPALMRRLRDPPVSGRHASA